MTGGAGRGQDHVLGDAGPCVGRPPAQLNMDIPAASMASLPQYTAMAMVATLPPSSFGPSPMVKMGSGWFDASDCAGDGHSRLYLPDAQGTEDA